MITEKIGQEIKIVEDTKKAEKHIKKISVIEKRIKDYARNRTVTDIDSREQPDEYIKEVNKELQNIWESIAVIQGWLNKMKKNQGISEDEPLVKIIRFCQRLGAM